MSAVALCLTIVEQGTSLVSAYITVLAESSDEARRVVMDMFPGAVVTGVHRIKK
jgi:hypothetical protein